MGRSGDSSMREKSGNSGQEAESMRSLVEPAADVTGAADPVPWPGHAPAAVGR